jgi:hypothetical protein
MGNFSVRVFFIDTLYVLMGIYAISSSLILNQPYLLPSLTNLLMVLVYGSLYFSERIIDYDNVDSFEFYYLILSLFTLTGILFYSLFDSTVFQKNSVNSIIVYVGSFGTLKTILKFVYQARYIRKH